MNLLFWSGILILGSMALYILIELKDWIDKQ